MNKIYKFFIICCGVLLINLAIAQTAKNDNQNPTLTSASNQVQVNNPDTIETNDINQTLALPPITTATPTLIPNPPTLSAKAYVLMDANSGYIIAQKNATNRMPPASLTKLMTLYIIANELKQGQINADDKVTISNKAWKMDGSKMFIKQGSQVNVADLIQGIIVASGNDATIAMAEYIGGTEQTFVDLMNQTANILDLTGTHYEDCNGLPAQNHYTTPLDIAKLARAWVINFPEYYPWFQQKWMTYNGIKQPNRNRLLWRDSSVDGLKTGHTKDAGFCLAASAKRDDMRLIAIVMGAPTDSARANNSEALLNYGFRFFESHKIYAANTPMVTPRIWFGKHKTVALGLTNDLFVTIPTGQYKNIKATIALNKNLQAPIVKGQAYGNITIVLNDHTISQQPLIALQDDSTGGVGVRLVDHVGFMLHRWFGKS